MQALQLRPGYYDAAHNLASVYEAQQDFDRAAAQYHAAHALRPSDALCLGNLGIVLRQQGRLDESAAAYVRACLVCFLVCCVGGRHSAAAEGGAELKHAIGVKLPPPPFFCLAHAAGGRHSAAAEGGEGLLVARECASLAGAPGRCRGGVCARSRAGARCSIYLIY